MRLAGRLVARDSRRGGRDHSCAKPIEERAWIIPARWAFHSFPGQTTPFDRGQAVLQHVWERCRRAKNWTRVIIATDDMRIAEAAFDWGAEVALTSPDIAAEPTASRRSRGRRRNSLTSSTSRATSR